MAVTTTAISGNAVKNNGGTVVKGGAVSASGPVVAPFLTIAAVHPGNNGSKIPAAETNATIAAGTDSKATFQPYSAGNYGQMVAGDYIMTRYHSKIAGQANTLLNSGSSSAALRRSIHHLTQARSILVRTAGWNYVTGAFLTAPTEQLDLFGNDDAAHPTRAIPGEFVYTDHGMATKGTLSVPVQDDYESQD